MAAKSHRFHLLLIAFLLGAATGLVASVKGLGRALLASMAGGSNH